MVRWRNRTSHHSLELRCATLFSCHLHTYTKVTYKLYITSSVASSLKTQTNVIEFLIFFRNAKKTIDLSRWIHFVIIDRLPTSERSNWTKPGEFFPRFPHENDHKTDGNFVFCHPNGGEHVFSSPKKIQQTPPKKIIPSDSVKMSSKIQKKTWISKNQVLPNPHLLPRRLPFVQLDNSQRGAVGCDIRTSVQRVENFPGVIDVFEDLGKKHKVSRVYLIWYQIWCVYIYIY